MKIILPLDSGICRKLHAGDTVMLQGVMYAFRDAVHKRLAEALDRGEKLPLELEGQTIYYMAPSPAKPGQVIGAAGPTTAGRMDCYTVRLIERGVRVMIGKGPRNRDVKDAIKKYECVYFAAMGGAGALISKAIKKVEVIAFDELGAEALRRLEVEDFPAVVVNDMHGKDLFEQAKEKYGAFRIK